MPKPLAALFLFFISTANLCAQEWNIGTTWYYYLYGFIPQIPPTVKTIQIVGDSVINGFPVFKIQGDCQCSAINAQYLRKDGDKVYWYEAGAFHLLYDFSLNPGDSLHIDNPSHPDKYALFRIDSIDYYYLPDGDSLKVQFISMYDTVTYQHLGGWSPEIIENIGNVGCMFPIFDPCDPATAPLICFETQAGTWYPIGATASCAQIVASDEPPGSLPEIQIRPNVVGNTARVIASCTIAEFSVFDLAGRRVFEGKPEAAEFDLSMEIPARGVYFVVFRTKEGRQSVQKIIKAE